MGIDFPWKNLALIDLICLDFDVDLSDFLFNFTHTPLPNHPLILIAMLFGGIPEVATVKYDIFNKS